MELLRPFEDSEKEVGHSARVGVPYGKELKDWTMGEREGRTAVSTPTETPCRHGRSREGDGVTGVRTPVGPSLHPLHGSSPPLPRSGPTVLYRTDPGSRPGCGADGGRKGTGERKGLCRGHECVECDRGLVGLWFLSLVPPLLSLNGVGVNGGTGAAPRDGVEARASAPTATTS